MSTDSKSGEFMTRGVGTRSWMAPEVLRGVYGKSSDIFSVCMVMWEIITGREPYEDTGQLSLACVEQDLRADIRQIVLEAQATEGEEVAAAWEELRGLVESGLSLDPSKRPTAEELVKWLQDLSKRVQAMQPP